MSLTITGSAAQTTVTHNDVVTSGLLDHGSNELSRDRSTRLVLLVLSGIGEVRDDGGDASSRSDLASMDEDKELHEAIW